MRYFLSSIRTFSYWKYALFSTGGIVNFFAVVGGLYTLAEILDFFGIYTRDNYDRSAIVFFIIAAIFVVMAARLPISRIIYRPPKRDFVVEVRIGDMFAIKGERIISSNTTFDTDISAGLIAPNSLQGQFASKYFLGKATELDRKLDEALSTEIHTIVNDQPGKKRKFPMGTIAKVSSHGENFYFAAMSDINGHGNAVTDVSNIEHALRQLWRFMTERGELGDIVIPLMGTGRGRIEMSRKKVIEKIAQSFVSASAGKIFSNRLIIVVHPSDAEKFAVNLFEVKDYLNHSLHA